MVTRFWISVLSGQPATVRAIWTSTRAPSICTRRPCRDRRCCGAARGPRRAQGLDDVGLGDGHGRLQRRRRTGWPEGPRPATGGHRPGRRIGRRTGDGGAAPGRQNFSYGGRYNTRRGQPPLTPTEFSSAVTAITSAFGDPTRREIYLFAPRARRRRDRRRGGRAVRPAPQRRPPPPRQAGRRRLPRGRRRPRRPRRRRPAVEALPGHRAVGHARVARPPRRPARRRCSVGPSP